MDRLRAIVEQIVALFRGDRVRAELDEELRHHLEMEIRANVEAGMTPRDARRKALLAFGGTDWFSERVRDERWGRVLEDLARDIHFGLRNLRRRLAFTSAAVVTLSLGIGMTTTMFVLVDAILLRPLPGANADGMVYLRLENDSRRMRVSPTPQFLRLIRDHATSFSRVEAYTSEELSLSVDGEPIRARGARASVGFFSFLGVRPALGRTFLPSDGQGTASPVVVLSHTLWVERFAGSPDVLGRTIRIGDQIHEVVGVLPEDFRVGTPFEALFWTPEGNAGALFEEGAPVEGALAKLAPGVSLDAARAELDAIVQNNPLKRRADLDWVARVYRPSDVVDSSLKRAILVLQAAALIVLLVGCGNLTNLLLAQGETRGREFALRASLGARQGRLVRQLLTESLLLGLLGGLGGILLTLWTLGTLPLFLPPGYAGVAPSAGAFLFATGIALVSVLAVGLLPALHGSKRGLADVIKGGAGPTAIGRRRVGIRQVLVTAEVAMTVLLLVGAGLLFRSFAGLSRMNVGFDRDLLTMHLEVEEHGYDDPATRAAFYAQLKEGLEQGLPPQLGEATLASGLVENLSASFAPLSAEGAEAVESDPTLLILWGVSPGYFEFLGLPVRQGRDFTDEDSRGGDPPVIISEAVARRYFSDVDPVGRRLLMGKDAYRVVGVTNSLRLPDLEKNGVGELQLFFPIGENDGGVTILVRSRGNRAEVVDQLKQIVWRIDSAMPVQDIALVDDLLADSLAEERSNTLLMILFAGTALLLGAVGIYGVVAYSVSRRTREMGIRMALGASAAETVSRLVMSGMSTVSFGLVVGVVGALALGRSFGQLLYQVGPRDPWVFAVVISVTAGVSLLATWLPARRAAGSGPIEALKND